MNQTATHPIAITDKDFSEQVLQSEQPVLVDFWAEWCAPCRALGPVIHTLAADFDGKAKIAKIDVDANQQVAAQYGIRSIPTVILFDKGQVVETFVGVRPKSDYAGAIDKLA
ncbi:MAG: thioredoxin [Gammaproteobacteria bacterium]|nr:thioredoxin [Gammaproteobacteria bacterium]